MDNEIIDKKKVGRPREHNREQIALDLIEWAKKPSSINLCEFCCTYDPIIPPSKLTKFAKECDQFRQTYEACKAFIGQRREKKLNDNELHVKAYDLNAKTYDYFLREEYRNQLEFESSLKSKDELPPNDKRIDQEDDLIKKDGIILELKQQIEELQALLNAS